ncbi:hypothetical protein BN7_2157 [Wickerhamomyces ciferrii]|uniref:Uncharacterized protein n=1 Tax=Wickerhamomyces ciferrii (strain ATCC 14091 / BCRC 22168 / CBS 111 / JCM 3599 / NBRC 0793 / NRRL Y-1031 F-60-10) TaxID=1206466 RepID=K0KNB3_WICCF|nr:uncharacterized protein BN7_2157 [Wickerhamomyces ciferrii]CCH42613.1 hypothetical protein BN7_2157 [Wickerhamomyces ciferrii]
MSDSEPLDRKPNAPGWVPPREGSNYNPYDPLEQRPPQGYPSEFKTPGKKPTFGSIPKDATQYQHMKETIQRLQYTPRPKSQLYPGQYKVLRRVNNYSRFQKGALSTGKFLTIGIGLYSVFFYRWNDGYDNVFSDFYRMRLRIKYIVNGGLSEQELEDLKPKQRGFVDRPKAVVAEGEDPIKPKELPKESEYLKERPSDRHLMEAQMIVQDREERLMRALDIAHEQISKGNIESTAPKKKLFGIF